MARSNVESWPTVTGLNKKLSHAKTVVLLTFTDTSNYLKTVELLTEIKPYFNCAAGYLHFCRKHTHDLCSYNRSQSYDNVSQKCDTYRSKMDDSLRGHRASHEANKLQLRTMFCNRSHRPISDLENGEESLN